MTTLAPRLLFVCLGNICRSPLAHGVFRDRAAGTDFDHFGLILAMDRSTLRHLAAPRPAAAVPAPRHGRYARACLDGRFASTRDLIGVGVGVGVDRRITELRATPRGGADARRVGASHPPSTLSP